MLKRSNARKGLEEIINSQGLMDSEVLELIRKWSDENSESASQLLQEAVVSLRYSLNACIQMAKAMIELQEQDSSPQEGRTVRVYSSFPLWVIPPHTST